MLQTDATRKSYDWLLPVYILILAVLAFYLSVAPLKSVYADFIDNADKIGEIIQIAILTVIMSLCRSIPVPTRKGEGFDLSSVAIFAAFLAKGLGATIIILLVSAFFTFDRQEDGKITHIFNTFILKTLFNNLNLVISAVASAYVFDISGGLKYESNATAGLPYVLVPCVLFLVTLILTDSIFMGSILFLLKGVPFTKTFTGGIWSMTPTLLALSPIGFFIAYVFRINGSGPYLAILFMLPLLFARFAFKLYLESKEQFLRTISTLTAAIEAKDKYTEGHSKRVAQYAVEIAQAMKLSNSRIENIKVAAVLHDIGKIGIDDEILRKPTKLDDSEWDRIVQHPTIGIRILDDVVMPETVKDMIHYHHVRYDRSGYPPAGRDKPLPMEVHIVSLADAYDAMTSDRPYRNAMSDDRAAEIIRQESGTQFHPDVVEAFLRLKNKK